MKPYTRSIVELFDGKKRYLIPLYQRQYAWRRSPQLELLWEDIQRAVERLTTDRATLSPHFMGALVISQIKTFGKQVQAFEVIDGQQRLTTFQILLTALRDVAAAHDSHYAHEIQKYILNDGIMEKAEVEKYKLWPSLTDRRSFVQLANPDADLDAITPRPVDEDGFVRRSTDAYAYFREKIEEHTQIDGEFDEYRIERLFEALKEGLAAVSIELEGGDDPQTIFETLNSRGVDLSAADLMRNFIFQRAKGLGTEDGSLIVDKLYDTHWLPLDRAFWQQHEARGRQNKPRLDWMLSDHLAVQLGDLVSVDTLFESYRRWILDKRPFDSIESELKAISATAAVERRIFEKNKNDILGRFGWFAEAFDVSTVMPLVIYLATDSECAPELEEGLRILESYILRRDICGLTIKSYNRFFVGAIDKLKQSEGSKLVALKRYISGRTSDIDRWPSDQEWRSGWLTRPQYKSARQPRLRYLFEALEQRKRTALSEDIEIKSALTVEHIMPQSWRENWRIPNISDTEDDISTEDLLAEMERDSLVHTLGNLTLLTHNLNAAVSNGPFSVKMPAIRAHASLALNRELNGFTQWNEETIATRGAALFEVARKIWISPDTSSGTV